MICMGVFINQTKLQHTVVWCTGLTVKRWRVIKEGVGVEGKKVQPAALESALESWKC